MSKAGDKIIEGLNEALAHARATTEPHALIELVDEIISMYHTTRLSSVSAAEHILSKPSVKKALLALTPTPAREGVENGLHCFGCGETFPGACECKQPSVSWAAIRAALTPTAR